MTMALMAQALIHQLRQRIGEPHSSWDASHLAKDLFIGLDGDVRVEDDTIIVTYYKNLTPINVCVRSKIFVDHEHPTNNEIRRSGIFRVRSKSMSPPRGFDFRGSGVLQISRALRRC